MSVKLFAIVLAISSLRCYDCQITCEKALNYLGCTAESENNILQRGTASDDEEIQTISLVNCKITDIQEESFEGLPSLQTLDVSFNSLPTLNLGVLSGLSNVQTFNLSHNFITELPLGVFDQLTSLTALDLSNNKIAELSLGIFDANVYLRSLYLEVNELQGLPLGIFDKSRNIQEIDLSSNDMSSLLLGIFDSLPQLQIVDLTTSKFADMPSGIFDGNRQLTELHLAGNEITAIPDKHFHDLRRLTIVDLSDNKLAQIQGDLFAAQTALRFLNLSTNLLTDISQVTLIRTISTLDVSKNKISVLPTFNMPDLKYLDVSGNRLTNLGQNVGMSIPKKLKILKLYKNPWQCACLDQILTILRRRKINYEYSSYFEGKKPVCVVAKNKVNRCFRDTVQDQQLYTAYNQALKKYKDMSLL